MGLALHTVIMNRGKRRGIVARSSCAHVVHICEFYIVLLQILEMLLECFAIVLVDKVRQQEPIDDPAYT